MSVQGTAKRGILILLENSVYPYDNRVRNEAIALTEAGYHVSVLSPSKSTLPWKEVVRNIHVYRYPPPPNVKGAMGYVIEYGYSLVAAFVLTLVILWREGFDAIHGTNPPDLFVFIGAFFKLFGKRFVFDHHDLAPEMYEAVFGDKAKRPVFNALVVLEKLSCRAADHVIATNASYQAVEMQRGHVPQERITIVRNGPDLNRLRIVEPDLGLSRKAKTIIGYVGVMGAQDRIDCLLKALYHLVYDLGRTDFLCVLIGTGDAWQGLVETSRQLGIESYVLFTGSIPDEELVRTLSTVDICVDPDPANPFTDRSTMVKMMEYMTFAKPIVAFDLTEHHQTADGAALYVPNNDEFEFARAVAQLMDDPARRQAMGQLGRKRVETELAWKYWAPRLVQVYDRLFCDDARIQS